MIGSSLLMASFGFMVNSISRVFGSGIDMPTQSGYRNLPINSDGTITVKLIDDQFKRLLPKETQKVDISKINGIRPYLQGRFDEKTHEISAAFVVGFDSTLRK